MDNIREGRGTDTMTGGQRQETETPLDGGLSEGLAQPKHGGAAAGACTVAVKDIVLGNAGGNLLEVKCTTFDTFENFRKK